MIQEQIFDSSGVTALCERLKASERVGLDTEFHSERTYSPRLMVLQIAFPDYVAIVDPLTPGIDLHPILAALESVTVVGHALQSDLKIFAERFSYVPPRLFDTQIAASFLGYGMQISLGDLVHDIIGVRLAKSQTVSDWSTRPLTAKQMEYLVDDVLHLLPMHDILTQRLTECGRLSWCDQECVALAEPERYRFDRRRAYMKIPGSVRMNRRELGVLSEIVAERDHIARERDLPPKYIVPDDVISGIAQLRPKSVEDLTQLRRLEPTARRNFGARIIDAVARGEAIPDAELPERPNRPLGPNRETLATLLGVAIGEVARESNLPQGLLATRTVLERIARETPSSPEALAEVLDLAPWRSALVI
ncbi:MAG TPA: ribonuclease D, partial [Candidatus Dormibacteraeota bacterium]|nr:ribonuclease D [Candidatus Dormibacteraeota bacterium]